MRFFKKGLSVNKKRIISGFLIIILLAGIFGFYFVQPAKAAIRTWDGGGGADTNWSTCANWSTDTCPTSADTATFDNTSDNNSTVDATFGGAITIVNINSGYDGTITLARSLTVSSTFTQAAGFFTAAAQALTVTDTFTLSAGSFTASSGTTTFSGSITISGSPTFTHNSGTITFSGTTTKTLACNNTTFNLVTFSTTRSVTVNSDCNLPLGANPTVSFEAGGFILTLNGTLTGTGTLTLGGGAFLTLNASTATLSGFSGLSTTGTFTVQNSAVFNAGTYTTFSIGSFTMSGASSAFTAPSGTMSVTGNITITAGTFTHNSGTISLSGTTTKTLACNNTTFNLVTFSTTRSVTVNSDCNLPLGANPTVSFEAGGFILTLNGTLTGTGTLTLGGGAFLTLNASTATLSGFSGLSTTGTFTVQNSAVFNAGTYTTFSIGSFTMSGASSAFTAPSGTMTVQGSFTLNSGTTFTHNSGTITFNGINSTKTLACNNTTFNLVTFSGSNNRNVTVNSDCNLPLGANPTLLFEAAFTLTLNGTLTGTGTLTMSATSNLTLNASTATLSGFSGLSVTGTFTVQNSSVFNAGSYTTFSVSAFTMSGASSAFTAPTGTMSVTGSFTNTSGTFTANGGRVNLNGTSTQTIAGSSTFYNLDLTSASARTVTFTAGTTQTVANQFTAKGVSSGSRITMGSSSVGTAWNLTVNGPEDVKWANIRDSNACGGRSLIANDSTNTANNSCWNFVNNSAKNPTYILKGVKINQGVRINGT